MDERILDATCGARSIWFDHNNPDCVFVDNRVENNTKMWLDKITDNADEQRQILDIVECGNWNMEDTTFKSIFDELQVLGYEVVIERAQK